jgi:nitric oxide dioxygenase
MRFQVHPLSEQLTTRGDFARVRVDREVAQRLRTSLQRLRSSEQELADTFYRELFRRYPGVRSMFPTDMSQQKKRLVDTLEWVVTNLDRPEEVREAVQALGKRHEGYGAKPEHYPLVRDVLVWAMQQCAAGNWSDDLEADWTVAIDLLSDIMLGRYEQGT